MVTIFKEHMIRVFIQMTVVTSGYIWEGIKRFIFLQISPVLEINSYLKVKMANKLSEVYLSQK